MGQRWTSGGKGPLAGDREKFKFPDLEHTFWTQPSGLTIEFVPADLNTTRVEEAWFTLLMEVALCIKRIQQGPFLS